jgi:DNA-binding FadR family transcriptional regulator
MVSDDILNRIVDGEFPPGSTLPGELELTAQHEVSRMTIREAVKTLEAQHVVRVERGRGTFVNPLSHWTSMEAVLRAASEWTNDVDAATQLIDLRRMLESGAAELAASRITAAQLDEMRAYLGAMSAAHASGKVDAFVEADLAFHGVVLQASANVFVAVVFEALSRVLAARRAQTSKIPQIQANAIAAHAHIVEALASGSALASRRAMDGHMEQTMSDLVTYVLGR